MFIKTLSLVNFRSFINKKISFNQTTLLIGDNGIGKTSIIEAIFLLSSGTSFRAGRIEEMIRLGEEIGRVSGLVKNSDEENEDFKLDIMLTRGVVGEKKTQYRVFSVNEVKRRKKDFIDKFSAVVFRPEDLRLVEGSPSRRRSFLDTALSNVDWQYASILNNYEEVLKKRNKLLWLVREGEQQKQVLTYWNLQLVKHGEFVQKKRQELVNFLNTVSFSYNFVLDYHVSIISEKRLGQYLEKEIASGHTLIGPHKDDFSINYSLLKKGRDFVNIDLLAYGSRGQQRLGVLWLKLGELSFTQLKTSYQPVLLLDDIMSELDDESRRLVFELFEKYQVILTTADRELAKEIKEKIGKVEIINL